MFKRALRDAQRNIDKLSTQGLKAACNGIIGAILKGNEEMVDKAIDVAVQESARYFAERIARTEKARAYMDGQCTHMPMIPTVWLSGGNFRAAIHAMTFVTCTPVQTFGGAMKREIMIRSQDQILRVFLYFSIRKPSISVIIIAI